MEIPSAKGFLPRAIGLSITTSCPIACPHCIIEAGPHRNEDIDCDAALSLLSAAALYGGGGIPVAVFTGGEPFYRLPLLDRLLSRADALGIVASVITNAFWAAEPEAAVAFLESRPPIAQLTISTDANHRRFISIDKVRNALEAARRLSIPAGVAVCLESEADFEPNLDMLGKIDEAETIRFSFTLPAGRAARKGPAREAPRRSGDKDGREGCASLDAPLVYPDGRVFACMGMGPSAPSEHPLCLGDIAREPLEAILGRPSRFALTMRRLGMSGLMDLIGLGPESRAFVASRGGYRDCALCYAMAERPDLGREVVLALESATDLESDNSPKYRRHDER
jgi:hypothetical protein